MLQKVAFCRTPQGPGDGATVHPEGDSGQGLSPEPLHHRVSEGRIQLGATADVDATGTSCGHARADGVSVRHALCANLSGNTQQRLLGLLEGLFILGICVREGSLEQPRLGTQALLLWGGEGLAALVPLLVEFTVSAALARRLFALGSSAVAHERASSEPSTSAITSTMKVRA